MNNSLDVFSEIPCLTEKSVLLNGLQLQKKWFKSADKRYLAQYLQKFIDYNKDLFNFLGVTPFIVGSDQSTSLYFRTSQFVGSIPLRSPDTGKQIGDFVVIPRYTGKDRYEDYIEILDLMQNNINPESMNSLPLTSGRNFRPPLYLEAVKFIAALDELLKKHWRKFDSIEKIVTDCTGQINWNKYLEKEFKVENKMRFPTRKNVLSELHSEFCQIKYVFDICKNELLSHNTPLKIKASITERINNLEQKLNNLRPKEVKNIKIHFSDNTSVKNCKIIANKILTHSLTDCSAWRVDFANVFEKYVQYIFNQASIEIGGKFLSNCKFGGYSSKSYNWLLKYLEPDGLYIKKDLSIMVDAKYKSHLFNRYEFSEILKEDHRHDLHQLICYSSFSKSKNKFSFLCYPSTKVEYETITYKNEMNDLLITVFIIGIPMKVGIIKEANNLITKIISNLEYVVENCF